MANNQAFYICYRLCNRGLKEGKGPQCSVESVCDKGWSDVCDVCVCVCVCVMVYLCVMCVKGLVMCVMCNTFASSVLCDEGFSDVCDVCDVPFPVGTGTTKSLS